MESNKQYTYRHLIRKEQGDVFFFSHFTKDNYYGNLFLKNSSFLK